MELKIFLIIQVLFIIPYSSTDEICLSDQFCCETNRSMYDYNVGRYWYYKVVCKNVTLEEFPGNFFETFLFAKIFDASAIGLERIDRNSFKSASEVTSLDLSRNKITSLGSLIFDNLPKLQNLFLNKNLITTIKSTAFEGCSENLLVVDLSDNFIKILSGDILDSLGKNGEIRFNLSNNQITSIEASSTLATRKFHTLDLSNNGLTTFQGDLSFENISIISLDVSNNNLTLIKIDDIESIDISGNEFLKTLPIKNFTKLKKFAMKNVKPDNFTIALLRNASLLQVLDLSNFYIGPLKVDDFSEMTSLKELYLKQTGISQLTYGTFSHQKNLSVLDISDNALESLDLHILSGLLELTLLDISGNNITKLDRYEHLRASFPKLETIGLDSNNWNCTNLARMHESLNVQNIKVKNPTNVVKNTSHLFGIGCTAADQTPISRILSGDDNNVVMKLNEIIEQLNEEKKARSNLKLDIDVLKSEMFKGKNDLLDVKTQFTRLHLTTSTSNVPNANNNEFRVLVEQMNNFTLEKQKLSTDQVMQRMNELQFEMLKLKHENEKISPKALLQNNKEVTTESSGYKFSDIALTVVITVLIVVGLLKLKGFLTPIRLTTHFNRNQRGSTQTIQTTDGNIEMRGA